MQEASRATPGMDRASTGLVLVGEWRVADPDQQHRTADAALAAWDITGWPTGLLAHSLLLGEDDGTVLHYLQWSGESACRGFAWTGRNRWVRSVDAAVPGIGHRGVTAYRWYRSTTSLAAPPPAGCLVTVEVRFDGPDPQRQRKWTDGVFAAAGTSDACPAAGLLAAHFHLSVDGTQVLNLAEWTTANAHQEAAATPGTLRRAARHFPGVTGSAVRRYAPYRRVTAGAGGSSPLLRQVR
jgi:hypothetical protein